MPFDAGHLALLLRAIGVLYALRVNNQGTKYLHGVLNLLNSGCQWSMLPEGASPARTAPAFWGGL
jgi:hypothetical protein